MVDDLSCVGFSLDVERLLNYCRDGTYNNDRRNGVRKAHGQKNVDRGYALGGNPAERAGQGVGDWRWLSYNNFAEGQIR